MDRKELLNKLHQTNPERVKDYLDVLDRVLLQAMVHKFLEHEEVENILNYWQSQVKSEINFESSARSDFLMGTPIGRMVALADDMPDGETLRMDNVKAMDVAKEIAFNNYLKHEEH